MDAGPVIHGFGFAASGFGLAAARAHGRFDHAYPLSLEMIALSWPLPVVLNDPTAVRVWMLEMGQKAGTAGVMHHRQRFPRPPRGLVGGIEAAAAETLGLSTDRVQRLRKWIRACQAGHRSRVRELRVV